MSQLSRSPDLKPRSAWLRGILGFVVAMASWGAVSPAAAAAHCGPGAHWVHLCPGPVAELFPLTGGFHTIEVLGVGIFDLFTTGPATIWRGPGMMLPDHHINTELVSLMLTGGGITLTAGDGTTGGTCTGPLCSLGRITEQGDPMFADSFFDVFAEITGTPFGPLRNRTACTMAAVIDRVPPPIGTTYICANVPVDFFDVFGDLRARLLFANHIIQSQPIVIPEPATLMLVGSSLLGLFAVGARRRRGDRS